MARKSSNRQKETISREDVGTVNSSELVNSEPATEQSAAAPTSESGASNVTPNAGILTLKGTNKSGKTASYVIPGQMGSVRVAKSAVTNESFPQSFSELVFKQPDQAKLEKQAAKAARGEQLKLSAAERAAKLEARIQKANLAAQKNADKLAKLRAKLQPANAQEQTEAAAASADAPVAEEVGAEA